MIPELLSSLVAALGTLIAGFVMALLNNRFSKAERAKKKEAEALADAVHSVKTGEVVSGGDVAGRDLIQFARRADEPRPVVSAAEQAARDWEVIQDLIRGYHHQALQQAKIQFWFSIIAASIGFIYILYAALGMSASDTGIYLRILPGAVIDGVAALFFRQAEQTRERATALYDRLRSDNQSMQATRLVESIEDQAIKSAVKAQLALHMSGLKPKEIDLTSFLTSKK